MRESRSYSGTPLKVFALVLMAIGLYLLSKLTVQSSYPAGVLPSLLLIATGMGLVFVPITLAAVTGVRRQDSGVASAMLNVGQQVGGTIGLSALVTIFGHAAGTESARLHQNPYAPIPFTHGADAAFHAGAIFMVVAIIAALTLIKVRPEDMPADPAAAA